MAKNSAIVLAAIIAVLYFFSAPGVLLAFPEANAVSKQDPTKINKVDLAIHAAIFGLVLAFGLPLIQGISDKL